MSNPLPSSTIDNDPSSRSTYPSILIDLAPACSVALRIASLRMAARSAARAVRGGRRSSMLMSTAGPSVATSPATRFAFGERTRGSMAEVGRSPPDVLDESGHGPAHGLEVAGEGLVRRGLLEHDVDAQAEGRERRTEVVVQVSGQAHALFFHCPAGDAAKQRDVVVGESHRAQQLLDDRPRLAEPPVLERPECDVPEVLAADVHGKLDPKPGIAGFAPSRDDDRPFLVVEHHLATLVWNEEGQISQRRPPNGHRIQLGGVGQFLERHERRMGGLEPLHARRMGGLEPLHAHLVQFRRCRSFFYQHAPRLSKRDGDQQVEEHCLQQLALENGLVEHRHDGHQPGRGEQGGLDADAVAEVGSGEEGRRGQQQQVRASEPIRERDGEERDEDPRNGEELADVLAVADGPGYDLHRDDIHPDRGASNHGRLRPPTRDD